MIRIKNLALNLRTQSAKVKIRQPLGVLYVRPRDEADPQGARRIPEYADQILEEGNLKKLVLIEDEAALVKVRRLKPDTKKLGPRAGKQVPEEGDRAGLGASRSEEGFEGWSS